MRTIMMISGEGERILCIRTVIVPPQRKSQCINFFYRRTSEISSHQSNSSWSMSWYRRNHRGSYQVSHCLILMITQFWTSRRQPRRFRQHSRMTVLTKSVSVSCILKHNSSCRQVCSSCFMGSCFSTAVQYSTGKVLLYECGTNLWLL